MKTQIYAAPAVKGLRLFSLLWRLKMYNYIWVEKYTYPDNAKHDYSRF